MTETITREEEITMLREWLPDLAALDPYFNVSSEDQQELQQNLDSIKKEPRDKLGLVFGRFQPPHAGHLYMIEAALQVADTVVIGIGTPNRGPYLGGKDWGAEKKTWEENPLSALQRQEILQRVLKEKGLIDRVKFTQLKDYGDDKLWGDNVLEQLSYFGKPDIIVRPQEFVDRYFPNQGIKGLSLPKFNRDRYQGKIIRDELRAKGALVPFNAKPVVKG